MRRSGGLGLLLAACGGGGVADPQDRDVPAGEIPADTGSASEAPDPVDTGSADLDPDEDGDGVSSSADCDDEDPDVYPGAEERCDGVDNDCVDGPHPDERLVDGVPACAPCDAAGYWTILRDAGDTDDVGARLHARIDDLTCTYDAARDALFGPVDGVPAAGGETTVTGVYTGVEVTFAGAQPDPSVMNTEHAWPQSRGADLVPLRCDLNHLFPADAGANSSRGSLPFGDVVDTSTWDEGGSVAGGGLFEPRDAVKGAIARAILYVDRFYADRLDADDRLVAYERGIAEDWHARFPVSAAEQARAERIVTAQGIANPLVVCDPVGVSARLGISAP